MIVLLQNNNFDIRVTREGIWGDNQEASMPTWGIFGHCHAMWPQQRLVVAGSDAGECVTFKIVRCHCIGGTLALCKGLVSSLDHNFFAKVDAVD